MQWLCFVKSDMNIKPEHWKKKLITIMSGESKLEKK